MGSISLCWTLLPKHRPRQVLQERYDAFRVEVLTANDRHEHVGYEKLARRVERKEKQRLGAVVGNRPQADAEAALLQRMWRFLLKGAF